MYKVLIADDEAWIRKGIIKAIEWKKLQLELVGEACDGVEAYETALETSPQVLITDVRMPGMNGLTLAEETISQFPDIQVIIISGYEDFDYVKRAIQIRAISYLLKPFDKRELNAEIARATEKIDENEKNRELSKNTAVITEKLLCDVIDYGGADSQKKLKEWFAFYHESARGYTAALLQYDRLQYDNATIRGIAEKILAEVCGEGVSAWMFNRAEGILGFLFANRLDERDLVFTLHKFAMALKKENVMNFMIGAGSAVDSPVKIRESYTQAETVIELREISGRDDPVQFYSVKEESFEYPGPLLRQIVETVSLQDVPGIRTVMAEVDQFCLQDSELTLRDARNFFITIVSDIVKVLLQQDYFAKELVEEGLDFCGNIKSYAYYHDLKQFLEKYMEKAIEVLSRERGGNISGIVTQAAEYIRAHFSENISLNTLSTRYHVNSSYFSSMFKEKTGESFIDFLTRVRMEKAVEYLQDPAMKISRISQLVGYEDVRYFGKLFKKHTGMTPSEFRTSGHG